MLAGARESQTHFGAQQLVILRLLGPLVKTGVIASRTNQLHR